ncbi:hypothetical protein ACFL2O_09990 [Thermodesulfobacteriota bacterium]
MYNQTGYIEVDMFPADIDSKDHPDVVRFKELLEDVADEYNCCLVSFEIDSGTAMFSFDSEDLMAEIVNILKNEKPNQT